MSGTWEPSLGAVYRNGLARFRLWAPRPATIVLHLERSGGGSERVSMATDGPGYWAAELAVRPGDRYGYLVDGEGPFPDPCSRAQPDGVHGLSEVIDPGAFHWTDGAWTPPPARELMIYECHVGTFTTEGTFEAAAGRLPHLASLGVNAVELMPVAAFPGRWNWGYDGVALFSPCAVYGGPDGLRHFVDAAHNAGIAVILDVVYNHFGPAGNYTERYAPYVDPSAETPWGAAIAFSEPGVRRFYVENLLHWVHEYHIDGFRFDATHAIVDPSPEHILAELSRAAATQAHGPRPFLVAESHENDIRYVRPLAAGGYGFDATWADDFHHAMRTLLCGDCEGYFANFDGTLGTLADTIRQGFFYEGQPQPADGRPRGTPSRDVPWSSFVYCLQNHDQVGNRAFGDRLTATASHAEVRAASMLLLLLPQLPLLFQGQEWFAATPFQYFTDHEPGLGQLVTEGRRREFAGFRSFTDPELRAAIPDPQDPATFLRSKLNWDEATAGIGRLALDYHRALLRLRRDDPVLQEYRARRLPIETVVEGRVLSVHLSAAGEERWIMANFGEGTANARVGARVLLHSDDARFGGVGREVGHSDGGVLLPPRTAAFIASPSTTP